MTSVVVHIRLNESHCNSLSTYIERNRIKSDFSEKLITVPQAIYSMAVHFIEETVIPSLKPKEIGKKEENIEKTIEKQDELY